MELLFTHRILVQFSNIDEVFCNLKNLTHVAYKIGEILKIYVMDLYVKWSIGSMIIVKVSNINKLVGCIKIMSLLENVELGGPHGN